MIIVEDYLYDPQSEEKFKTDRQRPGPGQIIVKIEGVQRVVLVGNIQEAKPDFSGPMQKTITQISVKLPETGIPQLRRIALVDLGGPNGLQLAEKTARQII